MDQRSEYCEIEGCVEHITYRNEQNGFTVFDIEYQGELVCVVGEIPDELAPGENVKLSGTFSSHPTYGDQFKATLCIKKLPESVAAIRKYLENGTIKGIGKSTAKKIVDTFGKNSFDIIENSPEELTSIKGITLKKALGISQEFKKQNSIRSVMAQLSAYSIPGALSIKLWKKFGDAAADAVELNPYSVCAPDIGADFDFADRLAASFGISAANINRIKAGLIFILAHNLQNGHTCLPVDKLLTMCSGFLCVSEDDCISGLNVACADKEITVDSFSSRDFAYLPEMYDAERYVGGRLALFSKKRDMSHIPDDNDISVIERETGILYDSVQREAIKQAMSNDLFIMTGGPGTGKTTTLNAIILLSEMRGESVALAAPTGRAAKRIAELTGHEAKTIHRLLECDFSENDRPKFRRNEKNPLKNDVLIIDEMSMVDIPLFASLLHAVRLGSRLILVGDKNQLPSVGPGNVLGNMISCGAVACVELTRIFRQAAESMIVTNAHKLINGEAPSYSTSSGDFFLLKRQNYTDAADTVADLCSNRLPKSYGFSGIWDIQTLCPGKKGELGSQNLNVLLQRTLNPPSPDKHEFKSPFSPYLFRENDKIMQIKNNYDIPWKRYPSDTSVEDIISGTAKDIEFGTGIFNGDIGRILAINPAERTILTLFDDRVAEYSFDMSAEIEPAYAITVHKSQGSEYDAVIMPLMRPTERLYFRNLLYTAVTRAKKLLIIVGYGESVDYMIKNNRKTVRYSNLDKFILRG